MFKKNFGYICINGSFMSDNVPYKKAYVILKTPRTKRDVKYSSVA